MCSVKHEREMSSMGRTGLADPWGKVLPNEIFLDDLISVGGQVKRKGEVIKKQRELFGRPPNMNCRIETFSRICHTFDERRTRWVNEMGFGGLLSIPSNIHLPRQLGYWLMTRIDPVNKVLIAPDGKQFRLAANQVHWVLGIPNRGLTVPTSKSMSPMLHDKVLSIQEKYGQPSKTRSKKFAGRVYTSIGIPVNSKIMERVEGKWEAHEEEEFKTLFLLLSLEMVLCPTQSPRLACDLFPALTCAMNASHYNWCELVLNKLMESVASFARRFYSTGVVGGCGGCTIFAVVFYLDKLNQFPVQWGEFPRVKVWNMNKIGAVVKRDRFAIGGDYGKLGSLDVAYGENHPKDARDSNGPVSMTQGVIHEFVQPPGLDSTRRRRGAPKNSISKQVKRNKRRRTSSSEAGSLSPIPSNSSTQPPCDEEPSRCHAISALDAGSMNWTISSYLECLLTRLLTWFHDVCWMGLCDGRNLVRMAAGTQTEVLFCGGADGLQLLRIMNTFIQSPCSQFLALLIQTQDCDLRRTCNWLVAKSLNSEPTQLCLLRADYPSTSYHVVKSRGGSAKDFYAAIYDEWSEHIPCDVIVLAK